MVKFQIVILLASDKGREELENMSQVYIHLDMLMNCFMHKLHKQYISSVTLIVLGGGGSRKAMRRKN